MPWPSLGVSIDSNLSMDDIAHDLSSIRRVLRESANADAAAASRRFVPSAVRVYGVRMPIINDLARRYRSGGFALTTVLWRSGAFEERLLSAKVLGLSARKDPQQTLEVIETFAEDIEDWAVCDTLGMQSIKAITASHRFELLDLSKRLIAEPGMWKRRLGVVVLTHYAKDAAARDDILATVRPLRNDKRDYITKALLWLDKDLTKPSRTRSPRVKRLRGSEP